MRTFLNYLEIFLNEFRKYLIAMGELDNEDEAPQTSVIKLIKQKKLLKMFKVNSINLRRLTKMNASINEESMETFENKYLNIIESLFTFVLIWVISIFISDKYKYEIHQIIIDQIKNYRKCLEFKFHNSFGNNFFELFENQNYLTVFEIIYDLSNEKWILLNQINFQIGHQIINRYDISTLNHYEILRLNPKAIKLEYIQKQIKNEQEYLIVLNNYSIFIETPKKRLAQYFLEFLIEYEKNFIIVGEYHSGKSSLIQDLYKCKLERNQMDALIFSVDVGFTIRQVYNGYIFILIFL